MRKIPEAAAPYSLKNSTLSATTAGFSLLKVKEGDTFASMYEDYNQLIFLLSGKAIVNSSEALEQHVRDGELFFMPISAEMTCKALTDCSFLLFYFDKFMNLCDRVYFRELWGICSGMEHQFQAVPMHYPLPWFANDMVTHFSGQFNTPEYQLVKYEEFLYLLRSIYTKREMANIFYPIIGRSLDFRRFILENYLKVKNIDDLVKLSALRRKTFDRQFNEEFGIPPYQWILKQKAKHVYFALSETNEQMQEIMRKYGFTIAPHFTRFCKDYFNATPLELRKRLRIAKANTGY
jgi:AraC-like DNA-binding protein